MLCDSELCCLRNNFEMLSFLFNNEEKQRQACVVRSNDVPLTAEKVHSGFDRNMSENIDVACSVIYCSFDIEVYAV